MVKSYLCGKCDVDECDENGWCAGLLRLNPNFSFNFILQLVYIKRILW